MTGRCHVTDSIGLHYKEACRESSVIESNEPMARPPRG